MNISVNQTNVKQRLKPVSLKKALGQNYTRKDSWKTPAVMAHIDPDALIVDPFAGGGDLLRGFANVKGYDIDPNNPLWVFNDSLHSIPPQPPGAICLTNPVYLGWGRAKRLGIPRTHHGFPNLYLRALDTCLKTFDKVIAIVPTNFLGSGWFTERLIMVDIIEESPFEDTTQPVLVAVWGPKA